MASDEPDPLTFEYSDASDDPLARRAAAVPRGVADALDALGCAPLGYALAVLRLNGHELVTAVWRDADASFEVALEPGSGRAEASTLFDDGAVVTTAQRPPWAEWIHLAPGLRQHPRDRHEREWVDGPVEAVVDRHRARLAEARREGRAAVPVDSMRVHFALRRRAAALREARLRPQLWLAAALALAAGLPVAPAVAVHLRRSGAPHHGTVVLAMLAANLVALPAHHAFKWFVAPWMVRLRPGPPPRRAARMLAEAAVPRGRVRRDG